MDFIVHTFGGGSFLWPLFNALGMVFASDSQYFTPVAKLSLTLGGLWAACRAIFKGNFNIFAGQWLLPSFLIFTLMFSPKATVWLKDEVSMEAPAKIDNIPFGIAFFASVSSRISYAVAEMLEKHLLPASAGVSSSKTGIMFGAKAIGKVKDVLIQDPITLTNSKEFLRQCFVKPYIMGNILGKKAAAQQAEDILSFVEQNIPNNFGIYYRNIDNTMSFKKCREATPLIKEAIQKELNGGLLAKFASSIGVQLSKPEQLTQRLKAMTGDTLRYLKNEQTDVYLWMKQAMLLNASREALDDLREKFSLPRLYPALVSMNATRGLFQQSFSYLVAGEMAAQMMPIVQSVFFALVLCMSFFVFPVSLLPGCYHTFQKWIVLIAWVASWPVFFTVIHCIGTTYLASKVAALGDNGLSMLSQGGFSEMMLHTYATFQMFAAAVPVLSWAVVQGCTHAVSALAGQFTPVPVASNLGANIADNNISMDNHSIGNRTYYQQNLSPNLQMAAGTINDGNMSITTTNGDQQRQILTEYGDSLVNNYRSSDFAQSSYQNQYNNSKNQIKSLTDRESSLITNGVNIAHETGMRLSREEATSIGLTVSDMDSITTTESTGWNNGKYSSDSTATEKNIRGGLGIRSSVIDAGGVINFNKKHEEGTSTTQQESYNKAIAKIQSAILEGRITSSDSKVQSLSNSFIANHNEQMAVGREIAQTQQEMEQLSHNINYVSSNSAVIDRNLNEPVLNAVIDKKIPGVTSKEHAVRWINTHREEAEKIALEVAKVHNIVPTDLNQTKQPITIH